jgi:hypothetical protein
MIPKRKQLPHGVAHYQKYKLGKHINVPQRDAKKHATWYNLRCLAVQYDTFEAWEVLHTYEKAHNYKITKRKTND